MKNLFLSILAGMAIVAASTAQERPGGGSGGGGSGNGFPLSADGNGNGHTVSNVTIQANSIQLGTWSNTVDSAGTIATTNGVVGPVDIYAAGGIAFTGPVTNNGNEFVSGTSTAGAFTGLASGLTNANGSLVIGHTNSDTVYFTGNLVVSNSTVTNNNLLLGYSGPNHKIVGLPNTAGILATAGGVPAFGASLYSPYNILLPGQGTPTNAALGAIYTILAQYITGSASSFYDLPQHENDIKLGMTEPVLGVTSDCHDAAYSPSTPGPQQTNYLYMVNMALYFNTSGVAGQLKNFSTVPVFLGDNGWMATNRDSGGGLQVLPTLFPAGVSNTIYQCHSNGMGVILANYFTTITPLSGDTAFRCDYSGNNQFSYPSQASSAAGLYTFPMTTADRVVQDSKWYYTNFIDGFSEQDDGSTFPGVVGYYHDMDVMFADAALYPITSDDGRVYWKNYVNLNNGAHVDGSISSGAFNIGQLGLTNYFPHQLWQIHFENHARPEAQYSCNVLSPDTTPSVVGSDTGLKIGMAYIHTYDLTMSNWNGGNFPYLSLNSVGNSATTYSNYYAIVGEFNACSFNGFTTNGFGSTTLFGVWDVSQTAVVTNKGFLSVWTDVEHYPRSVFDDYTNTVRIRKYKNAGQFAVLGVNNGSATSNYNVSLLPVDSTAIGSIGLVQNQIYTQTNVYESTFVGFVTNNLITNLVNATKTWTILTPYKVAVTNGGLIYYTPVFSQ